MTKKYKMIRLPQDVYEDWANRQQKIQERVKLATNKNSKISMTNVFRFWGKKKVYVFDDEVVNFISNIKKKRKLKFQGESL